MGDEQDDSAKLSSLYQQGTELYQAGNLDEAIPIGQEFLELCQKALGPDHRGTAIALNNLGLMYRSIGDYAKAEPLFKRALKITEKTLGPDHRDTATALNILAGQYLD